MKRRLLIAIGIIGIVMSTPSSIGAAQSRAPVVLEEVLSECRCVLPGMPSTLLATLITDFGVLSDESTFIVAFWTSSPADQYQLNVPAPWESLLRAW